MITKGKAKKILSNSFQENHKDVSEDRAMELIFLAEKAIKNTKEERNTDDKLNAAKNIAKDLGQSYSSAINYEKAKIQFLVERVEELQDYESGSGDSH